MRGHGARARVSEQIDQHIVGGKQEEVVVRGLKTFLAFLPSGPADRLDAFNAKRLDDGSCDGAPRRNLVNLGCFRLFLRRIAYGCGSLEFVPGKFLALYRTFQGFE